MIALLWPSGVAPGRRRRGAERAGYRDQVPLTIANVENHPKNVRRSLADSEVNPMEFEMVAPFPAMQGCTVMSTGAGRRYCPYCQIPITSSDNVRICPLCQMPHHDECWRENGGCTTFGCTGDPRQNTSWAGSPRRQGTADYIDLTADDAVVCHHCGHPMSLIEDTCRACGAHADARPATPSRLPAPPPATGYPYPPSAMGYPYPGRVNKSPVAACLLNLLLLGAGYFYLGKVGKGLLVLVIGIVVGVCSYGIGTLVMLIYAMVDCYNTAEAMNRG